jgi:hypothetical protein
MQLLGFFFLAFSNSQILLLSPVSRVFGCILYLLVEIKCGCVSLISRITVSRVYGRLVFGAWHSGRSTLFYLPLINSSFQLLLLQNSIKKQYHVWYHCGILLTQ